MSTLGRGSELWTRNLCWRCFLQIENAVFLRFQLYVKDFAIFDVKIRFYAKKTESSSQVWNRESRSNNKDCYACMFSMEIGLKKLMLANWFEAPGGLEKLQETCKNHPAHLACQNSFILPSHCFQRYVEDCFQKCLNISFQESKQRKIVREGCWWFWLIFWSVCLEILPLHEI